MTTPTWHQPPKTPHEFRERLDQLDLSRHADRLVGLARQSIQLKPLEQTLSDDHEQARTRLGGRPLLPERAAWPTTARGQPLSFVAQVDCAEVAGLLPDQSLPQDGLLSFFYEATTQRAWGDHPADAGHWAVRHTDPGTPVTMRDFPAELDVPGRFPAAALTPEVEWTFPPAQSYDAEQAGVDGFWSDYEDVFGQPVEDPVIHRLLGHPDPLGLDMQVYCQMASNGVAFEDGSSAREARLLPGAANWRLLLQVDSAVDIGMLWRDTGRLYYWMRDDDLRAGAWDRAWLILQCC